MRSIRNVVIMISLVFLVFAASPLIGARAIDYQDFKFEQLGKTAAKDGFVRVIVKMDVPDIDLLTTASTRFKSGFSEDKSYAQFAADADIDLDSAISRVRDSLLYQLNGKPYIINRTFSTIPFVALTVFPETLEKLKTVPVVTDIYEDRIVPLLEETPAENEGSDINKPFLEDSVPIVGADVAWDLGYTGYNWYVAILDTGLRTSHEMFQGKNIVEQCYSVGSNSRDLENGGCPNGKTEMSGPGSAAPISPQFSHGTHVAGIAAGNNGVDHIGVAKDADIIAVQVFSFIPAWNDVGTYDSDWVKGLEFVYSIRNQYNIASVNMSFGADSYSNYCGHPSSTIINNLKAAGIASVVASGNEQQCNAVSSPACVEGAVTVTGSDKGGNEYTFGNWNDILVDLVAPGTSIESATAFSDTSYAWYNGTSMSTPHVTGAWAIIKQFDASLSVDEILQVLKDSGTLIYSNRCADRMPKPQINIGNALNFLFNIAPPLNLTAEQFKNQSLLQTEYINKLTWEKNPRNQGKNITSYKIYRYENRQLIFLGEVDSSTFTYLHRKAGRRVETTYGITAVNDQGDESSPYYHTIDFGNLQN